MVRIIPGLSSNSGGGVGTLYYTHSILQVEQSSRSHLVKKNKNLATALEEARTYLAKVRTITLSDHLYKEFRSRIFSP